MAAPKREGFSITLNGEQYTLNFADLGPADARKVRKATGMTLARLVDAESFDLDSLCALLWLARVKSGQHALTYAQAEAAFPSYADAMNPEILKIAALEDDEDDSPEA